MKMINQKVSACFVFFVLGMASFQSTNAQSLAIDPVDTFRLALGNGGADRLVKMKESLAAMKSAGRSAGPSCSLNGKGSIGTESTRNFLNQLSSDLLNWPEVACSPKK